MSFDNNGGCGQIESASPVNCKPDYEAKAAALKINLDATVALEEALFDFSAKNGTYNFKNISSFAEMVGGVALTKRNQSDSYEELLKKIEAE